MDDQQQLTYTQFVQEMNQIDHICGEIDAIIATLKQNSHYFYIPFVDLSEDLLDEEQVVRAVQRFHDMFNYHVTVTEVPDPLPDAPLGAQALQFYLGGPYNTNRIFVITRNGERRFYLCRPETPDITRPLLNFDNQPVSVGADERFYFMDTNRRQHIQNIVNHPTILPDLSTVLNDGIESVDELIGLVNARLATAQNHQQIGQLQHYIPVLQDINGMLQQNRSFFEISIEYIDDLPAILDRACHPKPDQHFDRRNRL